VHPGCSEVRAVARLTGTELAERYAQLHAAVEAHCPVQDMLSGITVESELELA
jgi:putative redox protein